MSGFRRKSRADKRRHENGEGKSERREQTVRDLIIRTSVKEGNLLVWIDNPMLAENAYSIRNVIQSALAKAGAENIFIHRVIINMEQVPYADTAAVTVLLELHKKCREEIRPLILFRVSPRVREFMEIIKLHEVFDIRDH